MVGCHTHTNLDRGGEALWLYGKGYELIAPLQRSEELVPVLLSTIDTLSHVKSQNWVLVFTMDMTVN